MLNDASKAAEKELRKTTVSLSEIKKRVGLLKDVQKFREGLKDLDTSKLLTAERDGFIMEAQLDSAILRRM